ncbi:bacteriohemerythrin [Candidatus Riflebacteria bacterium]
MLEWDESYSVNVKEFDFQHRGLFETLNKLGDAMNEGKGNEVLGPALKTLVQYSHEHFAAEEKEMKRLQFPEYYIHLEEHEKFKEKVKNFIEEWEQGKILLSVEVLKFLTEWFCNHIQKVDKKYGPFFNENGLR